MKKNTIKAFTLVEMLIVIVIIGILIAALMPRMQAAQGRARDVSRKTALSQIQTAIVAFQGDKGYWPGIDPDTVTGAEKGLSVDKIEKQLQVAGMTSLPKDPNNSAEIKGIGTGGTFSSGYYGYFVTTRNGIDNGGFVLMAQTEVEGGSNWVVCGSAGDGTGKIDGTKDIKDIKLCTVFKKDDTNCDNDFNGNCTYSSDSQLRYIMTY